MFIYHCGLRFLYHITALPTSLVKRKPFFIMNRFERILATSDEISKSIDEAKKEALELETLVEGYIASTLKQENEHLRKIVQEMKEKLIQLEFANGIDQVPVLLDCNKTENAVNSMTDKKNENNDDISSKSQQSQESKKDNKEPRKKEKKQNKSDKKAVNPVQGEELPVDVGRLDFRIGKIIEVKKHPDADSLYVEQIDIGQENLITVVSGLVKHVPIEEMEGRMVVLLCNLKPAKMRGILSEAMVMCASTPEKVEILQPPDGAIPGDLVHVEGYPRNPDEILNPKKKIFETVAPDLKTDSERFATYKGAKWTVPGKGNILALSLNGVNIK